MKFLLSIFGKQHIVCSKRRNIGQQEQCLFLLLTPVWVLRENRWCSKQKRGIFLLRLITERLHSLRKVWALMRYGKLMKQRTGDRAQMNRTLFTAEICMHIPVRDLQRGLFRSKKLARNYRIRLLQ